MARWRCHKLHMRTAHLAALAAVLLTAVLLTACADDVWTIPTITTTGVDVTTSTGDASTTVQETGGCLFPDLCVCEAAWDCVVLGDLAACPACKNCPGEGDRAACLDFEGCMGLGSFTKCECNAGACVAGGEALGGLPCYACDVCGSCEP